VYCSCAGLLFNAAQKSPCICNQPDRIASGESVKTAAILIGLIAAISALLISPEPPASWAAKMFEIRRERAPLGLAAPPADHDRRVSGFKHPGSCENPILRCESCHGTNIIENQSSCKWCHTRFWGADKPKTHTENLYGVMHAPGSKDPMNAGCERCHGADLRMGYAVSCYSCHQKKDWR
jgi:hypothetical protein